jgi:hypothetical protein
MHWFQLKVFAAVATWSLTSAGATIPHAGNELAGKCPISDLDELVKELSKTAKLFFPGSDDFLQATLRWSSLDVPKVNIVVVSGTEKDVAVTASVRPCIGCGASANVSSQVKFANEQNVPFLAYNTAHAAMTTLGRMDHGIEIYLNQLNDVKISPDGKTVQIGGGTVSHNVTETLWAAGKQTGTHVGFDSSNT